MEKYEITKKQILELQNCNTDSKLKKWFPNAFKTELEVGKWYKSNYPLLIFVEEIHHSYLVGYGFNSIEEFKKGEFCRRQNDKYEVDYKNFNFKEATEQEVETALINEANKKYKIGDYINGLYSKKVKCLTFESTGNGQGNVCVDSYYSVWINVGNGYNEKVFDNGNWAEIIPTLTKKEAEEKLGVKII